MTRVLVTGATTPAGTALIEALLEDARVERVVGVVGPKDPMRLPEEPSGRLLEARFDLRKSREIRNLLFGLAKQERVDVLVHGALHRAAMEGGQGIHALNVESTRELIRLAARHPTLRRFVFRSSAEVYRVRAERPVVLTEDQPLELAPSSPQWVRDRVEADLAVSAQVGTSPLSLIVLRCAEVLHPRSGSQLYDYLCSEICLTPLGFDPMLNLLSIPDLVRAARLAIFADATGICNVPGRDSLPLSVAIRRAHRTKIPLPGTLLSPLYRLRALTTRTDFRYDQNFWRFHFSALLDGERARRELGYEPAQAIDWETLFS